MSQARHWILDGYNVMHALHFISPDLSFETARDRFISWVGQFQALGDKKVTIVFDDNVHREGPHEVYPRVRVIYSPQGFNADGTILSLVRQTPPKEISQLVVVTRDLMLRDAIFAYRCMVISPEAFLKEFNLYRAHTNRCETFHKKDLFYQPFRDLLDDLTP